MEEKIKDGESKIKIKKKYKYFKVSNFIKLVSLILIAIISGAFSGKLVVENIINEYGLSKPGEGNMMTAEKALQKEFSDGISKAASSLVTVSDSDTKLINNNSSPSNVTGVIVDNQGYIITNYSKIKEYKEIYVKLPSIASKPIEGKLIGFEENTDIAMIKIEANGLVPITIAGENSFKEGDFVAALGNATSDDYIGIVIPGIITATNKTVSDKKNVGLYRLIQTNATINKENTGGPLCNIKGELIGFNSVILGQDIKEENLYYALEARGVNNVVNNLISLTDILGINRGSVINDAVTGAKGVYIDNVNQDGYAAKAGIKPTDIITGIDGVEVNTPEDVYNEIKDKKIGDTIKCDILRDGEKTQVDITLD